MDGETCFKAMAPNLGHTKSLIVNAPLSAGERAKLSSLIAAFFYSTAVDMCMAPKYPNSPPDLEDVLEQLTALINSTARKGQKSIILNG